MLLVYCQISLLLLFFLNKILWVTFSQVFIILSHVLTVFQASIKTHEEHIIQVLGY